MIKRTRAALPIAIGAVVLVAAACSASTSETTGAATESTLQPVVVDTTMPVAPESNPPPATVSPTTVAPSTTVVQPITAASPPPETFDEVQGDYDTAVEALLIEGRAVADELLAADAEAIHARFDASMAAQLTVADMQQAFDGLAAEAPLTGLRADRALPLGATVSAYQADLEWGQNAIAMTAIFNDQGEVSGIDLAPRAPLPPDPAAKHDSEVDFRLPFDGLWLVVWGGDTEAENYHVVSPDQRHAYDLLVWKDGGTHGGDGSANEDYWAYGQPVLAPAVGTVVAAVDGLPDQTPGESTDAVNPAGNHVVIEVADGEYLLIAHMQPGSLTVAQGDVVERGQQIGLAGNSGNTSEPHVHIHLQDQPTFEPAVAMGLPLEFTDYRADGVAVERGGPVADQFIVSGTP